jgi:hypothetical protein
MIAGLTAPVFATGISCGQDGECAITITYIPQGGSSAGQSQTVKVPVTVQEDGTGVVRNVTTQFTDGATASIGTAILNPEPGIIFGLGAATAGFPAVFCVGVSVAGALGGPG